MAEKSSEEQAAEEQMAELEQMKKDYISTFSTEAGKKVLVNLENVCYIHRTTFAKGDAYATHFHEGMRFVVVHIKNMQNFNLDTLKKLVMKGE